MWYCYSVTLTSVHKMQQHWKLETIFNISQLPQNNTSLQTFMFGLSYTHTLSILLSTNTQKIAFVMVLSSIIMLLVLKSKAPHRFLTILHPHFLISSHWHTQNTLYTNIFWYKFHPIIEHRLKIIATNHWTQNYIIANISPHT